MAHTPARAFFTLSFALAFLCLAAPAQAQLTATWTFNQTSYDLGEPGVLLLNLTNQGGPDVTVLAVGITFDWQWGAEQVTNLSTCPCGPPMLLAGGDVSLATWCAGFCLPSFILPDQGISEGTHSYRVSAHLQGGGVEDFYGNDLLVYSNGVVEAASQPAGAYIFLDGLLAGTTPLTLQGIPPGTHTFIFFLPGYENSTQYLYVSKGPNPRLFAVLFPAGPGSPGTATLSVASEPAGAQVYLDDRPAGGSPLVLYDLSQGTHALKLAAAGYQNYTQDLDLVVGNNSVFVSMKPLEGAIQVTSTPTGASLYIDGVLRGTTPIVVQGLAPGPHVFTLALAGYANYTRTLVIDTGSFNTLSAVLSQGYGSLYVSSNPPGAEVFIDGFPHGITPVSLVGLPTGTHQLTLKLAGYQDHQANISLVSGENTPLFISLVPKTAQIEVRTVPPGATLFLNGLNRGTTPRNIAGVNQGFHEFRITLEGYRDYYGNILVTEGTNLINVTLEPLNGTVHVITHPDGARVYVDGQDAGTAPLTVESLSVGTHNLRLELEGYFTSTATFTVVVGEVTLVEVTLNFNFLPYLFYVAVASSVALVALASVRLGWARLRVLTARWLGRGVLFVYTNPPGATVKLDGVDSGKTPAILDRARRGPHQLHLEMPGYLRHERRMEIGPGLNPPLLVQLEPDPSSEQRSPSRTVDLVVDGSNATKVSADRAAFERVFLLDQELTRLGYRPLWVFDASYRHLLSPQDRRYFERLLEEKPERFIQSTAGDEADIYILSFAKLHDARVLSNDMYSDYFPLESSDEELNLRHLQRSRAKIEHIQHMGITRQWYLKQHITCRFSGDKVVVIDRARAEQQAAGKDRPEQDGQGGETPAQPSPEGASGNQGGKQGGEHPG